MCVMMSFWSTGERRSGECRVDWLKVNVENIQRALFLFTRRDRCVSALSLYVFSLTLILCLTLPSHALTFFLSLFLCLYSSPDECPPTSVIVCLQWGGGAEGMNGMDWIQLYESNNAWEPSVCTYSMRVFVCLWLLSQSPLWLRRAQICLASGCQCILPVLVLPHSPKSDVTHYKVH